MPPMISVAPPVALITQQVKEMGLSNEQAGAGHSTLLSYTPDESTCSTQAQHENAPRVMVPDDCIHRAAAHLINKHMLQEGTPADERPVTVFHATTVSLDTIPCPHLFHEPTRVNPTHAIFVRMCGLYNTLSLRSLT